MRTCQVCQVFNFPQEKTALNTSPGSSSMKGTLDKSVISCVEHRYCSMVVIKNYKKFEYFKESPNRYKQRNIN